MKIKIICYQTTSQGASKILLDGILRDHVNSMDFLASFKQDEGGDVSEVVLLVHAVLVLLRVVSFYLSDLDLVQVKLFHYFEE